MSVTPEEETIQDPKAAEEPTLGAATPDREPTNSPEALREPTNEG